MEKFMYKFVNKRYREKRREKRENIRVFMVGPNDLHP